MNVVIIGAGVAGLSIGWKLVQGGAKVLIVDRAQPARGATWAAAGMIAPTAETEHGPQSESEFARWSASLWPSFAEEVEAASGAKIGYMRDGALLVAMNEDDMRDYSKRASATLIDADELHKREPLLGNVAGALWDSEEARVDNRALGLALERAFVRDGGRLSPNEAAVSIEVDNGLGVRTPFANYGADKAVVAAGAWSSGLDMTTPVLPPVRPVKGEMLALLPPSGVSLPAPVIWGNGVYLVPRQGRLLIGATAEDIGFDTTTTDKAEDWLFDRALALIPSLRQWTLDDHWSGLRPASPDGLPVLGETRVPGLFVATGQFRNGILFAPAVAEAMSRLVLGKPAPEIHAFSPLRFGAAS
jgi:glycine oxidase